MTARSASHPFHQHELTRVDTRRVYAFCEARWRCDCCQRHFNGTVEGETTSYHCQQCEFDLCESCYNGSLHPFHRHYLQPAKPTICYAQTEGQWRCDACQRVFGRLTSQVGRREQRCTFPCPLPSLSRCASTAPSARLTCVRTVTRGNGGMFCMLAVHIR